VGTYRLSPLHLVRIVNTEKRLHLRATGTTLNINLADEGPAVFLDSGLYPQSPTRLATDVTGAVVERTPGTDELTLVWKDTTYTLSPVGPETKPPIEHLRAGNFEAGARGLRAARAAGMGLDNGLEFALTRRAHALHEDGDNKRALWYVELAAELFPTSRSVRYRLGRAHQEMGRSQVAAREYRAALALDPLYNPARERLREITEDLSY
jgi:tetratricopeptide (TPR) repeat protein